MKTYAKLLAVLVVAIFSIASSTAQAVTVSFDYLVPTDGSGKTSPVGVNLNNTAKPGYFIETYDVPNSPGGTIYSNGFPIVIAPGGGFTSLNPATDIKIISGGFGIQSGSNSHGAMPAGDNTFYAYAPAPGNGSAARLLVDYQADMLAALLGMRISYLGLYYGSIDTYNNLTFYTSYIDETHNTKLIGEGIMSDGVIEGSELLSLFHGANGNQFNNSSNIYVNLFFNPNETFTAFEMSTTGIAFEVDNIVSGFTSVPEPASMLLLGLGLVGLAGIRRKLKK